MNLLSEHQSENPISIIHITINIDNPNNNKNFDDNEIKESKAVPTENNNQDELTNKQRKKPVYCHHNKWSNEEDQFLSALVKQYGDKNWSLISLKMKNRNVRQCKERWKNYLNPQLRFDDWTKEEDDLLLQKKEQLGPRWTAIAKFFNNRTDAMIKTRYNALIRAKNKNKQIT